MLLRWQKQIDKGSIVMSDEREKFLVIDRLTAGDEVWFTVQCARGVLVKPSYSLLPLEDSEVFGD
jgi:hypothetical protein